MTWMIIAEWDSTLSNRGETGALKKNSRTKTEKLQLKKYDPVARKHVVFKETKMK